MEEIMVKYFGLPCGRPEDKLTWPWMSYNQHGANVVFMLQNFPAADRYEAEVWPERGGGNVE